MYVCVRERGREGGREGGRGERCEQLMSIYLSVVCVSIQVLEGEEHSKVSRINLIDLAGSERSSVSHTSGERLKVYAVCVPVHCVNV